MTDERRLTAGLDGLLFNMADVRDLDLVALAGDAPDVGGCSICVARSAAIFVTAERSSTGRGASRRSSRDRS